MCRQVGQVRECPSLATSFSRHGDLQKAWKQGKSFGCLKVSKQIEHSSCSLSFLSASFVATLSAISVSVCGVQHTSLICLE